MPRAFRYAAVLLAVLTISAARQDDNQPNPEQGPQAKEDPTDALVFESLRGVINHGADVYNTNDHAGCYRIYEGSLMTVKPLLGHRPDVQKTIVKALEAAEGDPVVWRRAFTLRAALDKVRAELNPKKDEKKLPPVEPGPKEQPKDQNPKEDK